MELIPIKMTTTIIMRERKIKTPLRTNSYLSHCQQSKSLTLPSAGEGMRKQILFCSIEYNSGTLV